MRLGLGLRVGGAWALGLAALGCTTSDDLIATLKATSEQGGAPSVDVSPCALKSGEAEALSRFDFEDAAGAFELRDSQGLANAQLMDGTFGPVPGPEGCGTALGFGSAGLFAQIPNLPNWDLEAGSVDFWFRVPDSAGSYGILGRDHVGTETSGHLSAWLAPDNTVTVRLQGVTTHATHCTDVALAPGHWAHIGFNFGPPGSELFVDGALATRTGDSRIETIVPECGGVTTDGIAGNDQPWVLGFDTSRSGDALDGLLQHFSGGAIDALQISSVRRDFQAP